MCGRAVSRQYSLWRNPCCTVNPRAHNAIAADEIDIQVCGGHRAPSLRGSWPEGVAYKLTDYLSLHSDLSMAGSLNLATEQRCYRDPPSSTCQAISLVTPRRTRPSALSRARAAPATSHGRAAAVVTPARARPEEARRARAPARARARVDAGRARKHRETRFVFFKKAAWVYHPARG